LSTSKIDVKRGSFLAYPKTGSKKHQKQGQKNIENRGQKTGSKNIEKRGSKTGQKVIKKVVKKEGQKTAQKTAQKRGCFWGQNRGSAEPSKNIENHQKTSKNSEKVPRGGGPLGGGSRRACFGLFLGGSGRGSEATGTENRVGRALPLK
jgi:hypothetical protein